MIKDKLVPTGGFSFATIREDLPAGLVVFLVALPLCLGIALASGAPLFAGLIAGIVGGLVVSFVSGSQLAVSGPAAGLTVIVLTAITDLGSYPAFLMAVVVAGVLQIAMGFAKAGSLGNYFPSNVIKGMLAAIGVILIIKQVPHALGYDADYEGDFSFEQPDHENTFTALLSAANKFSVGAIIIAIVSLVILVLWPKMKHRYMRYVPAPLIVVIAGIGLNLLFERMHPVFALRDNHLVNIPSGAVSEFFTFPDFSALFRPEIYKVAFTLAIVASIETLLCIEAIDKLDPHRRHTPRNQELKAQGIGNMVSGLIGGLPLTAVIVRGSANVNAGAQSKAAAFFHGVFLILAIVLIPAAINMIPFASLAAILIITGYKLTNLGLIRSMWKAGYDQFIPFAITVLAIVFTDLLVGVGIGLLVAGFIILKRNMTNTYFFKRRQDPGDPVHIVLSEEVSFLNKAAILQTLHNLPKNSSIIIDGTQSVYIDYDVLELINDFKENARYKEINVELRGIRDSYHMNAHSHN